jgi:putative PEP-CTERM system TPR-repeat lipoprotein
MEMERNRTRLAGWLLICTMLLIGCKESPESLMAKAKESLAKNDRSTAMIHLKNALQSNPNLGEAHYLLGKSLFESGDVAAAERELHTARVLKVPDDQLVPLLARVQVEQGRVKETIEEFRKIELAKPDAKADLATTIAQAQLSVGNVDAARAGFSAARDAVPDYPPALLGEARLKALAGDLQGSMALVDSVLAKSPGLFQAWMVKGDLAGSRLQLDDAIAAYGKALELRADLLPAHLKIATMQIEQGKIKEATVHVEAMKKAAPKHPDTLYVQALLAAREQNYGAAREAIQMQLKTAPDNLPGLMLDGFIEYQLGSYAQAEASLQKALRTSPGHRQTRLTLVNTYLRQQQPGKALDALKPLLDSEGSSNADIIALAGEAYMQGWQHQGSRARLRQGSFAQARRRRQSDSARPGSLVRGRCRSRIPGVGGDRRGRSRNSGRPCPRRPVYPPTEIRCGA